MQETYTHHHLLRSIYGELDCCPDTKLKHEILKNPALAEEYRALKKSKSLLDSNHLSPKVSTVEFILALNKRKKTELV
jgi:hypothetical protein